jgi:(hydroxyamino)benzene mutase
MSRQPDIHHPGRARRRHPDDPEPTPASKARAVWWLGLLALITGPVLAGLAPATVALTLAGQFRREASPAGGFLTGAGQVRRGEWLAWSGVALATGAMVAVVVFGLFQWSVSPPGPAFPPHVD